MKTIFYKTILALAVATTSLFCSCNSSQHTHDVPSIVVSIEPQKYFLDKIAGDSINIVCLLENGANPENYEPSINDLISLEKSIAYIKMGNIGFEQILIDKLSQNNNSLQIFDSSSGINFITGTHDCCEHHHHEESHHTHTSSIDPHTWTSIKNAKIIARNMLDAVIKIDPENQKYYQANFNNLAASLDSLDNYATNKLAPHSGEAFLVWHPSLSYFARDYNLEQLTVGQIGKELSAHQLQQQIDNARNHSAKVFFFQREFDSQQASVINDQIGATMITINPLSYEWEAEIRRVIDAIASK